MAKIIDLEIETKLDVPANKILENAIDKLKGVVLAGYDNEGNYYFASSIADGAEILWLIENLKQRLFELDDQE